MKQKTDFETADWYVLFCQIHQCPSLGSAPSTQWQLQNVNAIFKHPPNTLSPTLRGRSWFKCLFKSTLSHHQWKSTNINKTPHLPTLSLQTIIQTSNLKGERIFLLFKENHPTIVPNRSYPLITSFLKDLQLLLLHNLVTVHLGGRNLISIVPSFKFSLK